MSPLRTPCGADDPLAVIPILRERRVLRVRVRVVFLDIKGSFYLGLRSLHWQFRPLQSRAILPEAHCPSSVKVAASLYFPAKSIKRLVLGSTSRSLLELRSAQVGLSASAASWLKQPDSVHLRTRSHPSCHSRLHTNRRRVTSRAVALTLRRSTTVYVQWVEHDRLTYGQTAAPGGTLQPSSL